jgi:alcohol dehydrogenase, propanol-preferring
MLEAPGLPLQHVVRPCLRAPSAGEVAIRVTACGVCRTDLHIVDGDLAWPGHPVVPGHEVVGRVVAVGADVQGLAIGERVGVPWLGYTCGTCEYCRSDRENLCEHAQFTGYQRDGGYAQGLIADARFVFKIPPIYADEEAAPLLCAGLIGYRALRMAAQARRIGLYGFGAAAHILAQVAIAQGREVHAFTRPDDLASQAFAREMGAASVGASDRPSSTPLDAAILFAPVGALVPVALASVVRGGIVVCAGIHMSDIPSFPYSLLWGERRLVSVANLTRADAQEFLRVAAVTRLRTRIERFALTEANEALARLRQGRIEGAAVLVP